MNDLAPVYTRVLNFNWLLVGEWLCYSLLVGAVIVALLLRYGAGDDRDENVG